MLSSESRAAFEGLLRDRELTVDTLDVPAAISAMIDFYVMHRSDDTNLSRDGDMLLFEWGTYSWGQGPSFRWKVTRQFITGAGDDEDFWQLSLTLHYDPTDVSEGLGSGNRWCSSPDEVEEFRTFVFEQPASTWALGASPQRVELDFQPAG